MRKITWAAFVLLAGCDSGENKLSSELSNAIVLECIGQEIDLVSSKREPASYLLKIDTSNSFHRSLYYYNWSEKRFVSSCTNKYHVCNVDVDSDLISESAILRGKDNQVLLLNLTKINRRTGKMSVVLKDRVIGEQLSFEGECVKGQHPIEQVQKF